MIANAEQIEFDHPLPTVNLQELVLALADVLKRAELTASHAIKRETLSVRERMTIILSSLQEKSSSTSLTFLHPLKAG